MDLTGKQYVERCRDGHPEDFGLLVDRYQKSVFAFLASRVENFSQAEEAAQESFVRAFLSLRKLRKPESFYSWLLGIAGRVAKEQFRAELHRRRDGEAAEIMTTGATSPAEDYPLEEVMAVLPENHRQVILLRYYEGLSCQEVATRLALPLGTVTKTLSRAYLLLRHELEARDFRQSSEPTVNQREQP
ncbi:MAG TPA: RNA polymerase sigma factor [Candidatus Acidoferrum sp.]|nr:RNA polymerase sigma factor [Candidatus Acidoferrum sp.]